MSRNASRSRRGSIGWSASTISPRARVSSSAARGGADSLALLALACEHGLDVRRGVRRPRAARRHRPRRARSCARPRRRLGAAVACDRRRGRRPGRTSKRGPATRATPRSSRRAPTPGRRRSSSATRATTRPRPCCCSCCGGAAPPASPAWRRGAGLRRPLLGAAARRHARDLRRASGSAPVHDPMNDELHHRRVWLRREVIPQLERGARRDLVEVLARQAEVLRDDDELLDALARRSTIPTTRPRSPRCRARSRAASCGAGSASPPPPSATVERVLAVARGERRAVELPGRRRVERVGARLHLVDRAGAARRGRRAGRSRCPGRARFGAVAIEAWIEHGAAGRVARRPTRARSPTPTGSAPTASCGVAHRRAVPAARPRRVEARARRAGRSGRSGRSARRVPIVAAGAGAAVAADARSGSSVTVSTTACGSPSRTRRYLWMSVGPDAEHRMNDPNIGRIVVDEHELQQRIRELGKEISVRLRRQPAVARRHPQGRVHVHGRSRPRDRPAGRVRLHGGVVVRIGDAHERRRAHHEGPRPRSHRSARADRRGHRRLRPHARVPAQEPARHATRRRSRCARCS